MARLRVLSIGIQDLGPSISNGFDNKRMWIEKKHSTADDDRVMMMKQHNKVYNCGLFFVQQRKPYRTVNESGFEPKSMKSGIPLKKQLCRFMHVLCQG